MGKTRKSYKKVVAAFDEQTYNQKREAVLVLQANGMSHNMIAKALQMGATTVGHMTNMTWPEYRAYKDECLAKEKARKVEVNLNKQEPVAETTSLKNCLSIVDAIQGELEVQDSKLDTIIGDLGKLAELLKKRRLF